MKTKVCPCCDQPIQGIYCKGCRKIVLHPVEWDIQYYLNARHPEFDHDCTFHEDVPKMGTGSAQRNASSGRNMSGAKTGSGQVRNSTHMMTAWETEAKKAEIKERMQQPKQERQSGASTIAQTLKKASQSGNWQKSTSSQTVLNGDLQEKRTRSALITAITMVLVIFTITFTFAMIQVINTMNSTTRFGWAEAVPEPMATAPAVEIEDPAVAISPESEALLKTEEEYELELPTPRETNLATMEEWELTDAEVRELGVSCNGFGHSSVKFDDVKHVLRDGIHDAGYGWSMSVFSYNQFIDEYTWYETVYEYTIRNEEEYAGYLNIDVDTATGEIHGIELYTHYEKGFFEVADIAMKFLENIGMASDLPSGMEFFETAYKNQGDEGYCVQNELEVVCYIPEEDEAYDVYQMSIYVPGDYTVGE